MNIVIDITGLDKAEVLAALHQASRSQGFGIVHDVGGLSVEEARAIIVERETVGDHMGVDEDRMYFDYVRGRVMKIDLSGDELDSRLYNRDVGEGAAENVVAKLRAQKTP